MPLFNLRAWHMINVDTGEEIEGGFESADITENVGAAYAEHHTLNRQHAILQFLHGKSDTLTFQARIYAETVADDAEEELTTLKEWVRRDDKAARPPIIVFWAGDSVIYIECVIEQLSGIKYDRLTRLGGLRGVTMNVHLRQYVPFDLESGSITETRYHVARRKDYYEMLCYREYRNPGLGDIIRKRHPDKPNVQAGDRIKLPSIGAIRKDKRVPSSIPLVGSLSKQDSPQKRLKQETFDSRDRVYISHILLD